METCLKKRAAATIGAIYDRRAEKASGSHAIWSGCGLIVRRIYQIFAHRLCEWDLINALCVVCAVVMLSESWQIRPYAWEVRGRALIFDRPMHTRAIIIQPQDTQHRPTIQCTPAAAQQPTARNSFSPHRRGKKCEKLSLPPLHLSREKILPLQKAAFKARN